MECEIIRIIGIVVCLLPFFMFYGAYLEDKETSRGDISDWIQMYR